jgi:hypothetical protein
MFVLSRLFAFELAGRVTGLGDDLAVVFELALLFEFSAVVHAAPKTARAKRVGRPIVRRISVPRGCNTPQIVREQFHIGRATHVFCRRH